MWTWTAIEADSKLLVSWHVGARDGEYALAFIDDLRQRLANRVQLTSDGHRAYLEAVEEAFGDDIDYAQLVKLYGTAGRGREASYSPAECIGARREMITGNPDPQARLDQLCRAPEPHHADEMRRFTRLTNAFSKKFENHVHMVALYTAWYNFVKIYKAHRFIARHGGRRCRSALEHGRYCRAGRSHRPKPGLRGPYRKQRQA